MCEMTAPDKRKRTAMLNKPFKKFGLLLASACMLQALVLSEARAETRPTATDDFAELLLGTFDSSTQAIDDADYLDVTVQHCRVEVKDLPAALATGHFIALRQSISTSENPYRVRILRVFSGEGPTGVRVSSFAPQQGVDLSELCFKPTSERIISFADLSEEKCTTSANKEGDAFIGGTGPSGCASARMGAVRMTSELRLDAKGLTTWDRGWDAQGKLAWGPAKGPYQFERVERQDVRLAQLATFFAGRFSNDEQVASDPQNFTPVEYEFCQVDFSDTPMRPDTRLMMSRQVVKTPARTIKRNRIYEFFRDEEGKISVRTNPFEDTKVPEDICQRGLDERRNLSSTILTQRDQCVLNFEWQEAEQAFVGGTPKEGCPSTFQGSVKMIIEEVIKDGVIQPWERWLNAQGEQVAGSRAGPYIYKRK